MQKQYQNPRDRSPYPRNRPKPARPARVDWISDELVRLRRIALRRKGVRQ